MYNLVIMIALIFSIRTTKMSKTKSVSLKNLPLMERKREVNKEKWIMIIKKIFLNTLWFIYDDDDAAADDGKIPKKILKYQLLLLYTTESCLVY